MSGKVAMIRQSGQIAPVTQASSAILLLFRVALVLGTGTHKASAARLTAAARNTSTNTPSFPVHCLARAPEPAHMRALAFVFLARLFLDYSSAEGSWVTPTSSPDLRVCNHTAVVVKVRQ